MNSPRDSSRSGGRIKCIHLHKVFQDPETGGHTIALGDFDIDIDPGEFITIVGPSGCGKTTFLNIVAGFETETAGQILVDNEPVSGPGPDRGVVFQEYALFPWLRVIHNVAYGLIERGVSRREARQQAQHWLSRVGLQEFGHKFPHELSGGMRQRVALIRVLANDPNILLMDEPFAALDALTRSILQKELESLWRQAHKTVVFVTHNVEEAIYLGDRMVIMSGRPSSIKAIVNIDLSRPRDVTSEGFNKYRRFAMGQLEEEQSAFMKFRGASE